MRILFSLFFFCISFSVSSQKGALFTNAKPIDNYRYAGVKASPYMFEFWVPATIYTNEGDPIEVKEFNINGYSKEIEVRKGDKFIELEQSSYARIEVKLIDDSEHIFVRNFANNFRSRFVELVHDGGKVKCVRQFEVPMIDFEIQNVGKTEKVKRFNPKFTYIFIKNGQIAEVKINEKKLVSYLGHKKELGQVMNKAEFKNNKLNHLKEVLNFYESL